MLKQQLFQKIQHKLSPKQIQLMKLVQLSTLDFEQQVKKELEENPALEKIDEEEISKDYDDNHLDTLMKNKIKNVDFNNNHDKILHIKNNLQEENYHPIVSGISFQEYLKNQLHTCRFLNKTELLIADFILGNIDDNGYIRRKMYSLVEDIFLILGISINLEKIETIIVNYIQQLEPIGVGARNLQECLLIQLSYKKTSKEIVLAKEIIKNYFKLFVKRHYHKLQNKLGITTNILRKVVHKIEKLNPKPGKLYSCNSKTINYLIPDFTILVMDGNLELSLNKRNNPELKISTLYLNMLKYYKNYNKKQQNYKNIIIFLKKKIDSAKWFLDAIKQRKNTLMLTMNAIMNYQKKYFLTGDTSNIKPMILKNISQKIGVGISTVSRVANSKYVNTPYGTFLIKQFFSEKMTNIEGQEISSIEIKRLLKEFIANENKNQPITDETLSNIFKNKGYLVARRTVSKYRNQMNIPVARLRKML
ncbi:RNA polymerase factor sigma-54 [Blattabacterium cuenoti]|uniref:RNA polymerase factor sigma-54 n=1 Tax=Blattabacterium cuenoti TaxID=1653831 RepID=UPI00163B6B4E|nr:RNA polymerase factor sigma-54 [Blattabacterium cuenoti]